MFRKKIQKAVDIFRQMYKKNRVKILWNLNISSIFVNKKKFLKSRSLLENFFCNQFCSKQTKYMWQFRKPKKTSEFNKITFNAFSQIFAENKLLTQILF